MPVSTLYVTGFVKGTKAKEIGDVFEKFGEIKRVDIPPPRSDDGQQYAFVEFMDVKDADSTIEQTKEGLPCECALDQDKGLVVQWARSDPHPPRSATRGRGGYGRYGAPRGYGAPPPRVGRYGSPSYPPRGYGRYDDYPLPPRRGDYDYPPRDRGYPPRERDYLPRDRDYPPRERSYPPRDYGRDRGSYDRDAYDRRAPSDERRERSLTRDRDIDHEREREQERERSRSPVRDRSRSPVRD